jgi:EamA domain-containing membrane protein RarD
MSKTENIVKSAASWLIGLIIAFIFVSVLFAAVGLKITEHLSISVIALVLFMSLPFYVIIRKKMLR